MTERNNIGRALGEGMTELADLLRPDSGWKAVADTLGGHSEGEGFPPMTKEQYEQARQEEAKRRKEYAAMKAGFLDPIAEEVAAATERARVLREAQERGRQLDEGDGEH